MDENKKPKIAEKELDKLKNQSDQFDNQVKELGKDINFNGEKLEAKQPEISQKQLENSKDIYIKPTRTIPDRQKFNERFRSKWEYEKEYVRCIPVHNELKGEKIEFWTHPYGGMGAEYWEIPSERPVWVPRYVAEQMTRLKYHRYKMDQQKQMSADGAGHYYGSMVVDTVIQRIDALPVHNKKSIFMGANSF